MSGDLTSKTHAEQLLEEYDACWIEDERLCNREHGPTRQAAKAMRQRFDKARAAVLAAMRPAEPPADARWKFIQDESLHLVPFAMPTGAGDADIGWRVLQSHMGKGDVVIAEVYRDRPAEAIDAARAALTKDAGECGACDKPGEHCANVHGICSRHGGRAHETSAGDSK